MWFKLNIPFYHMALVHTSVFVRIPHLVPTPARHGHTYQKAAPVLAKISVKVNYAWWSSPFLNCVPPAHNSSLLLHTTNYDIVIVTIYYCDAWTAIIFGLHSELTGLLFIQTLETPPYLPRKYILRVTYSWILTEKERYLPHLILANAALWEGFLMARTNLYQHSWMCCLCWWD